MDNSFRRQGSDSDVQQPHSRVVNSPHVFKNILHWLANLIRLTDAEQNEAGIYFGPLGDEQISVEAFSHNYRQKL